MSFWLLTQGVSQKEGKQLEDLTLSEATAISQSLGFYTDEIKKALIHANINSGPLEMGPFLAIAKLKFQEGKYIVDNFQSRSSNIKEKSLSSELSNLPFARIETNDSLAFQSIKVAKAKSYLLVLLKSKGFILTGFLKLNDLASLLDAKQTEDHNVFVLANKVNAIVHPEKKYLGANVDTHPISQLALSSKHISGVDTKTIENSYKLIMSFETVENTNLTVGVVHKIKFGNYWAYINWTELLMAGFILVVAMFLFTTITLFPLEKSLAFIRNSLNQLIRGEPLTPPEEHMKEVLQMVPIFETLQNKLEEIEESHHVIEQVDSTKKDVPFKIVNETEKYEMYKNFSLNLTKVLAKPLSALLGHLQMAKAGIDQQAVNNCIDKAQAETRKARSILDDLHSAVKVGDVIFKPILFEDVISDLLRESVNTFNEKGIRIHKNLKSKKYIQSQQIHLEKALSLIIQFLVNNFSEQIQRDLYFTSTDNHNELTLKIVSNSENLSADKVKNLIEPFKTEIDGVEDIMSLSIANILTKRLEGNLLVTDNSDGGVCIEMFLPTATEHEIQEYLDSKNTQDTQLVDISKDELTEVLDQESLKSTDLDVISEFNHKEQDEMNQDSFIGFETDEEDLFQIKRQDQDIPAQLTKGEEEIDLDHDQDETQVVTREEDQDEDDFVMVKPPKASDLSKTKIVVEPYASETLATLADKLPLNDEDIDLPEVPQNTNYLSAEKETPIDDLVVTIRKPKLRGDN
ncbi:MAG: HAMP domain-containing histidine kinase [Bdellovibrionales bacterium]|nr:HAMP domain-containing histidine kinase [Bdellovibrionales bacterium]